ncbi:MAG: hypothetical protein NW224_28590 [Leptolyngbyaceae cyanobacterium bins.302]|nr:hypothetical protein [Leptolyngbyaceae cyanobacterium bins.302]
MRFQARCANLPLTVYREVAAHLQLVDGVQVELVPQQSPEFSYAQSQIDSLQIYYADDASSVITERVHQILAYYADRYGQWETIESIESLL